MSDDKGNRGSPDRNRIDVNDPDEIRHWTKSFGVTPEQLKAAAEKVGTSADKVRETLRR